MNNRFRSSKKQAGVVLVVSLIMLMLLTLIGVSGMQSTGIEEKMAGNMRDRNLAFQAAEAALRHAEQFIEDGNANSLATNINIQQGPFNIPGGASVIAGLSAQPTYTITLLAVDYFATNPAKHATFQITATATGSNSATVRLRTIYIVQVV